MAGWTFQRRGLAAGCIWRQFLCNRNFLGDTFVFILQILWKRERKNTMSGSNKLA